jgi:hypothetical protein
MKQRTLTALVASMVVWFAPAHTAPRAADAPQGAVQRLPVKPGGPIAVEYRVAAAPVVGTPLEIAISARVEAGVRNVALEANPSTPRAVLVAQPMIGAQGDGLYSWTITVVPLAADAGYLTIVVSGEADGVLQARSLTVPLGSAAPQGAAPAAQSAEGEPLIALPVQESP